ncbi:Rhodanese-like protein [Pseudovirgaria hyperparasitica]|uniref:M-phase inducer phosphatase n=1 Tax=Pseudovirgaria hyperparasitica TaxID=470096 RepID=A0A6A6VYP2_9PEZI|nr:Rhodanese-like protein [Pseudovirgaria hyperparasitica]KAF2755778.1 Rhodanese-like protein [Pseudovirgaria hyperparasitica]
MEFSSPLAAMRPPQHPSNWPSRRDLPTSFATNLQFKCPPKTSFDYFTVTPVRGSSPAASLAADLSSNFHIDQSPQFATPRRSLFTSNLITNHVTPGRILATLNCWESKAYNMASVAGTITPPVQWEGGVTPPILSSPSADLMDISPLPHKAPFSIITQLPPQSSSLDLTSHDEDMLSPLTAPDRPAFEFPARPVSAQEKRKPFALRPSLARAKNLSTTTTALREKEISNKDSLLNFGSQMQGRAQGAALPDSLFAESPPREGGGSWFQNSPNVLATRRQRPLPQPFQPARGSSSPYDGAIRKPTAGPPSRRPTKFRRSLSMFENPADIMKQDKEEYKPSSLQSVMDVDDSPGLALPHFIPPDEPDSLPRITGETLVEVLNGKYSGNFQKQMVIDCRFEYEYEGGHIDGAVNFCEKDQLLQNLFETDSSDGSSRSLLIFHCEYSAHRAPLMAKSIRAKDRMVNENRYPHLSYPEVYILDGGYSSFFTLNRERCFPQCYTKMDSKGHETACEKGMNKLRHRNKLHRAQTFAFGEDHSQDSPTNQGRVRPGRPFSRSNPTDDSCFAASNSTKQLLEDSSILSGTSWQTHRQGARRQVSY